MNVYILAGIIIAAIIILAILKASREGEQKAKYRYTRKQYFMSRAERECYHALLVAVDNQYRIFAQVHLSTILNNRVKGQDFRAARAHIDRKSVDFILCDLDYLSPKLAIELDDRTHELPDRQERDRIVERILKDAGLPLLRLQNRGRFDPAELAERIAAALRAS